MHMFYIAVCISILFAKTLPCQSKTPTKCMLKLDLDDCYSIEGTNFTATPCHEGNVCHKQFNISYVKVEPYSSEIVADLLRTCCGNCIKVLTVNNLKTISQITSSVMNTSNFVFPVLGRSDAAKLYGHYFIPLVETPSIYYITRRVDNLMYQVMISCVQMWPLLVICLLMVAISGFLGWITETWNNKEEFPRQFFSGWFEGFWWSFVSMTTVGYGDKTPKSVAGRLLSIVWILIGITTFSLITAMLASEISKMNTLPPPTIHGANVGALRNRVYDAHLIAEHGGLLIDVESTNITLGVHQLIMMLKNKQIDGFVLDRYTLIVVYYYLLDSNSKRYKYDADFIKTKAIRTEISFRGDKLSYGALVKNIDDYEFLADFVKDNQYVINTCNGLMINRGSRELNAGNVENPMFSTSGDVFWPSFTVISIINGIILSFGVLYEFRRRKVLYCKNNLNNQVIEKLYGF